MLKLDSEFYNDELDVFEAFLCSTNAKKKIGDYLLKLITNYINANKINQQRISLLDIGCGPCAVEKYVLPKLIERFPNLKIKFTLIDSYQKLDQDVINLSRKVPGPEYFCVQSRLEDLHSEHVIKNGQMVDWIICSHLLYYLRDWKSEIRRILTWLSVNGVLFIAVRSRESPILQLQKFFPRVSFTNKQVYGEDVIKYFNENGIKQKFHIATSTILLPAVDVYNFPENISSIDQAAANRALKVVQFYTHRELWSTVTDKILQNIKLYLFENIVRDMVELHVQEFYILVNA